jgi:putrescine transport system substrate-binding protein
MRASLRIRLAASLLACLLAPSVRAEEPRVLNVYNWADYIGPTTIADFEAETGIRVNYDTYTSADMVEAKLLAGSTGYDVVFHAGDYAARLIPLGIFRALDRAKLPSWQYLDPDLLGTMAGYDPGNRHSAPYMWGSTGFAYDVERIRERLPDAPVESADMLFDPQVVARFADCGVSFLDSAADVLGMALVYLGHGANSTDPEQIAEAEAVVRRVHPYVRYYDSARMLIDLPNREICLAMSWSGDYATARRRAAEAGVEVDLAYSVPREGSLFWYDAMYVLADAPHPDAAHRFIDFVLRPRVIAAITNHVNYANAVRAARPHVDPAVLNDPAVYPTRDVLARLQLTYALPPKAQRLRTRAFARAKSGL